LITVVCCDSVSCGLQALGQAVLPAVNTSFGVELDEDVMCAIDKLERDYVLKEVNSCDLVTETAHGQNQGGQCHRKEKFSGRKVGANPCGSTSSRRTTRVSDIDDKSKPAMDAMSLTVIKGHDSDKVVSSAHDEASDQDVICMWNSPLLVSTPLVVLSKRRVVDENVEKPNITNSDATTGNELTATPKQLNCALKPKSTKVQKTKLFGAVLSTGLNVDSTTEAYCLQNIPQSPGDSDRRDSLPDGNSTSAASNPDSKLLACSILLHFYFSHGHRRFWHATLRLCSTIRRHHPPQRAVLSQICCFGERKVVLFQILLDAAEPRDAGTT